MSLRSFAPVLLMAAAVAVLGSLGCSEKIKTVRLPNQPPSVRLTYAPIDTTKEEFYVYKMQWLGFDPDGRVVAFQYVIDPPSAAGSDTAWITTSRNEQIITFTATKPESLGRGQQARSQGFHVFVVRALDNDGAPSMPVARAFFSFGVAPIVQVVAPRPSELLSPSVTPAVRISWEGKDFIDPNGFVFEKPVKYKYKLYKNSPNVPWTRWISTPDSMRVDVAPEFAGWDSCGPDTTSVQYTNLTPSSEYLFVVVAFGRSGAYSPIFTLSSNMLRMFVGFAGELGPKITIFNSFFSYTYPSGGFPSPLPPSWAVQLQVPSGEPLTFNWSAEPPQGSVMKRYRWVLDIEALDDETARTSQDDWYHWSSWSLDATSATIGPFAGAGGDTGEVHNFYLEAEDINGLVSLGWVQFRVFKPTFAKPLLVINDTRFKPDRIVTGRPDTLQAPSGTWPTRAELDTFLFAVGGVRWRMAPSGRLSPPGIFKGYQFDTLGTRSGAENPTIPLNLLGNYRHIVWLTDLAGSNQTGPPASNTVPMTTLLYMSGPNRQNTLATWVSQGGKLFGCGGGFGNATNAPWNILGNDGSVRIYASDGSRPDLLPGRFMYDLAHWRSEFRVYANALNMRFGRFDRPDPTPPTQPLKWKGRPWPNPPVGTDYAATLPREISYRDPSTDPVWPYRTNSDFYVANPLYSASGWNLEYLTRLENPIVELDVDFVERSMLDTLYMVFGTNTQIAQPGSGSWNVVMTHYHGIENSPMTFLGMGLWAFRRTDCVSILDCVLQNIWHLPKNGAASAPISQVRPAAPPARVTSSARPAVQPAAVRRPAGLSTFQRLR